jgi:hypothetical protein
VLAAAGSVGALAACFAPDAGAVTVPSSESVSSADWPDVPFTVETPGFAAAGGCTACGAGAAGGGDGLPATGKPPPGCPLSAVLDAALRAGFGLASCIALAKVDPPLAALAEFAAAALADAAGLISI